MRLEAVVVVPLPVAPLLPARLAHVVREAPGLLLVLLPFGLLRKEKATPPWFQEIDEPLLEERRELREAKAKLLPRVLLHVALPVVLPGPAPGLFGDGGPLADGVN